MTAMRFHPRLRMAHPIALFLRDLWDEIRRQIRNEWRNVR